MLEHIKSSRSAALESNQQEQERIVSRKDNGKDMWQQSLRPKFFRDYIGQETLRNNLSVYIEAAKKEKKHWTMYCFMVRRGWEKLQWLTY